MPNFVLTVRHSQAPDLAAVRRRLECDTRLLGHGPEAVLYAVLDSVVDGYAPVVAGLQNDIDEIETEVFMGGPQEYQRRLGTLGRHCRRQCRPPHLTLTRLQTPPHGVRVEDLGHRAAERRRNRVAVSDAGAWGLDQGGEFRAPRVRQQTQDRNPVGCRPGRV